MIDYSASSTKGGTMIAPLRKLRRNCFTLIPIFFRTRSTSREDITEEIDKLNAEKDFHYKNERYDLLEEFEFNIPFILSATALS